MALPSVLRRTLATVAAAAALATSAPQANALIETLPAPPGIAADSTARIQIGDMNCTATLIAPSYLLTAKHCIGHGDSSYVSLGPAHFGERHSAVDIALHPTADLAIIRLDRPSGLPVAQLSGQHLAPHDTGIIVGWGGVGNNPFMPVQQSVVSVQRRVFHVPSPEPESVLIETWLDQGRIQRGDSGGPLFVGDRLAGVAAMSNAGAGQSVDGTIGWYVPVAEYLPWISRWARIPSPPTAGAPAPLVDATTYPTGIPPQHKPQSLASIVLQTIPGLPFIPALSS